MVFGRLTVIGEGEPYFQPNGKRRRRARCSCECGGVCEVTAVSLRNGKTKSCGCLSVETVRERSVSHGHTANRSPSAEYGSWCNMLARCYQPTRINYADYGGRGISVCARWRQSFEAFLHDMGPKPSARHSLDRISSNGDYEPENCRWATRKQQARNRRGVHLIRLSTGEVMVVPEAAKKFGINPATLRRRLKDGWRHDDAVVPPTSRARGAA